jgi:hypothetical protein
MFVLDNLNKNELIIDRDLVAYSPESSQLLYMMDEEDYGDEEELSAFLFKW